MIDRFTQKAREAIRLAVETAQELEHGYVGTEHLLLGLIKRELAWRQRFWQNMM
ncbi:MAG: Clp protease N-terminal domain-containing protein [Clostridium fessum]